MMEKSRKDRGKVFTTCLYVEDFDFCVSGIALSDSFV